MAETTYVMLQPGQLTPELAAAVAERRADLAKQSQMRLAPASEANTQPCPSCDGKGRIPMAATGPGFSGGVVMPGMEPADSDTALAAINKAMAEGTDLKDVKPFEATDAKPKPAERREVDPTPARRS